MNDNYLFVNKRLHYDYEVIDKYIAGISLMGWEVKQIKANRFDASNAYIRITDKQAFLKLFKIHLPADLKLTNNSQLARDIKLLLHRREILKLENTIKQARVTAIISKIFIIDRGLLKIELVTAKGKTKYDKRTKEKIKQIHKEMKYL